MFCKNCGTDNLDTARFCVGCGTDLTAAPQQPVYEEPAYQAPPAYQEPSFENPGFQGYEQPAEPQNDPSVFDKAMDYGKNYMEEAKKDKKKLLIPIIAAAATVLILVVVLIIAFSGGKEDALDPYVDLLNGKGDADTIEEMMPEDFWKYAEEEGEMTPADLYDEIGDDIDDLREEGEELYGEDITFSYEVLSETELSPSTLNDLKDTYKELGLARKELTEAYKLRVEVTVEGDFDSDSEKLTVVVFKYDGDWYVDVVGMAGEIGYRF